MLKIKAGYVLFKQLGKKTRAGFCVFIILAANLPYAFANHPSQPEKFSYSDSSLNVGLRYTLNNSTLPLINEVSKLYETRHYSLIWSDGTNYNTKAHMLFRIIQNARKLGLNPADYDIEVIQYFLETKIDDPVMLSKSDVTFTHAYLKLSNKLNKEKYFGSYTFSDAELLNNGALLTAVLNDYAIKDEIFSEDLEKSPKAADHSIQINDNPYSRLLNAIEKYHSLNDDFEPIILQNKSLTIGDASAEIIKARKRLYELGDYKNTNLTSDTFDETLATAISDFQFRHGLEADGILGKKTVREINKSAESRALQLEINLDRARQISTLNDDRYILVNVPAYKLYFIENGKTIFETRVIVGKKKHKTPTLTSEISEFVLNPYWNVPKSITVNEIIPKLQEDPEYLSKNGMKIIARSNNQSYGIESEFIDWTAIDRENILLRIQQKPGKKNALGRVKFLFPNDYQVYLHDTPSRNLFAHNSRAFSHGCIRVENPLELAEVLISDSERWTSEKLHYYASRGKTKTIKLEKPIPIHITYMTAWADEHGIINFRPDIYKRDSQIANNLYNTAD
jgi:murein L,D-transpeptidase YcbB/YkuD